MPDSDAATRNGAALCLSGGGYRAMLFHVGSIWRLAQLGFLPKLERISSVSGGSITAATLALAYDELRATEPARIDEAYDRLVARRVRSLAARTIDVSAIITGLASLGGVSRRVAKTYHDHLFGELSLRDLPDAPEFVFCTTNVQSGALFRMTKKYAWDYKVGRIDRPRIRLAKVVAASSAFPPFLSPFTLHLEPSDFEPGSGDLDRQDLQRRVLLTDGGVYDNLGLEPVDQFRTIIASDGGGQMDVEPKPARDWPRHAFRILGVIDNQVRSLRKRWLIRQYKNGSRDGAYFSMRSHPSRFGSPPGCVDFEPARGEALARTPTRLKALPDSLQERLINLGYALCDAAMRAHVADEPLAPAELPYADRGI